MYDTVQVYRRSRATPDSVVNNLKPLRAGNRSERFTNFIILGNGLALKLLNFAVI